MTGRKDSHGDPINRKMRASATAPVPVDHDVADHTNALVEAITGPDALSRVMAYFADHDRGYLKVRRALDSSDLHLTYTWSVGTCRGSYVYVRVEYWRLVFGLELLQQKVLDVDNGWRKPSPDKRVA